MSSQKGNTERTRRQKYQNSSKFRNNMHDKTREIQMINSLVISGVCGRCKEIIDWKIKYKKYKPLSQFKTCVSCHQKAVKMAYYVMCQPCATRDACCAKCGEKTEIVCQPPPTKAEASSQQTEFKKELRAMSEKKRRKFLRLMGEGKLNAKDVSSERINSFEDKAEDEQKIVSSITEEEEESTLETNLEPVDGEAGQESTLETNLEPVDGEAGQESTLETNLEPVDGEAGQESTLETNLEPVDGEAGQLQSNQL